MSILLPQTEIEYRNALIDAAEIGATKALVQIGQLKPFYKIVEANKIFGKAKVKMWHEMGLIKFHKQGQNNSRVWIDKIEIITVAKTYRNFNF